MATFAERLTRATSEANISDRQIARDLTAMGIKTSHGYIGQLKRGEATNPGLELVTALAGILHKTVGWLAGEDDAQVPDAIQVLDDLQELAAAQTPDDIQAAQVRKTMEDLGVLNIAQRTLGLSQLSLTAIAQIIEQARIVEGLEGQNPTDPKNRG
ncbi:hypothetical protein [Streptosporangium sp. NPDC002524]|uniref:hypothetical protein n=1 Tax=Streptosporangium sp. NPDC002524 TaxID=3154537 RepID=UPI003331283C